MALQPFKVGIISDTHGYLDPKVKDVFQGVDHIIPVDTYLPGCPPRPEMLMDAILKLHEQIGNEKLGVNRAKIIKEVEAAALASLPTHQVPVFGSKAE